MLHGLKPVLTVSRCFGFHPFTLDAKMLTSRSLRIYSGLMCLVYLGPLLMLSRNAVNNAKSPVSVHYVIMHAPTPIYFFGLSVCAFATMLNTENLQLAALRARKFDELAHHRNNVRPALPWLAVSLPFIVWSGYFTYAHFVHPIEMQQYFLGLISRYLVLVEIFKFHFLLNSYRKRFRQLNRITADGMLTINKGLYSVTREITVANVYDYYVCLEKGIRYLNSFYSVQLLMWLAIFMLEFISFMYLLIVIGQGASAFREYFVVIYAGSLLFVIGRICHVTSEEANQLGRTLFCLDSRTYTRSRSVLDLVECGLFLYKRPVRVMVGDMFSADYPMLVTIIGIAFQYLIILFQL